MSMPFHSIHLSALEAVTRHRARIRVAGVLLALTLGNAVHAQPSQQEVDAVIHAARNGETSQAIDKLQQWHAAAPQDLRLVYDLAAVLGMANRHAEAMRYYDVIVQPQAPAYALKAIAASARAADRLPEAEAAYRMLLNKTPNDAEAHAGLMYVWLAQRQPEQALQYGLQQLPENLAHTTRQQVPVLIALAEVREQQQDWLAAAAAYQQVLRFEPQFRYAVRGRVAALAKAGMPHLAQRLAERTPTLFTDEEMRQLAHAAAAQMVLFGEAQLAADAGPGRYATTDRALQQNAQVGARFELQPATRFDRLVALRDRQRMQDAVALYEALRAEQIVLPAYAKAAAADAYLYLQQPQAARDLYRAALADMANDQNAQVFDWQLALVYAYVEAEQHEAATALADQLAARTPRLISNGLPGDEAHNPDYPTALLIAAQTRLYADRLAQAEQQLRVLRAAAPFHAGIRLTWANLLSARSQPRAALDEYTLLQVDAPASVEAALGRGDMLLALHELGAAKALLQPLLAERPEHKGVQQLARRIDVYERPYLRLETTRGRGGSAAAAESLLDATLYSAPLGGVLGERYRVFSHVSHAQGNIDGQSSARLRSGVGIDYRSRSWEVEAEVNHAAQAAPRSGLVLALAYTLSDHMQLRAAVDTNVNDLAARAYQAGITGQALKLDLTWTLNESRRFAAELSTLHFSDGNDRHSLRAAWNERWISGPVFKLGTTLAGGLSGNSLPDRVYFNPRRSQELELTLTGDWLTWRRYHSAFTQRLALSVGQYRQQGFQPASSGNVRYEHEWTRDQELTWRYGLGHGMQPYDGVREKRNYGYLNLYWHPK